MVQYSESELQDKISRIPDYMLCGDTNSILYILSSVGIDYKTSPSLPFSDRARTVLSKILAYASLKGNSINQYLGDTLVKLSARVVDPLMLLKLVLADSRYGIDYKNEMPLKFVEELRDNCISVSTWHEIIGLENLKYLAVI